MPIQLDSVYKRFERECSFLDYVFNSVANAVNQPNSPLIQYTREMCVIRLHDAWNRFCRELVLSSAGRISVTAKGSRLSRAPGVGRYTDVIPVLLSTYKKRRTEPAWHNPTECLDAASRLKITNYSAVSQGLSLSFNGPAPTAQMTAIRNYFAHRNPTTSNGVADVSRGLSIIPVPPAYELIAYVVQSGVSLYSLWVIRLKTMGQLAIQ